KNAASSPRISSRSGQYSVFSGGLHPFVTPVSAIHSMSSWKTFESGTSSNPSGWEAKASAGTMATARTAPMTPILREERMIFSFRSCSGGSSTLGAPHYPEWSKQNVPNGGSVFGQEVGREGVSDLDRSRQRLVLQQQVVQRLPLRQRLPSEPVRVGDLAADVGQLRVEGEALVIAGAVLAPVAHAGVDRRPRVLFGELDPPDHRRRGPLPHPGV